MLPLKLKWILRREFWPQFQNLLKRGTEVGGTQVSQWYRGMWVLQRYRGMQASPQYRGTQVSRQYRHMGASPQYRDMWTSW